MKKILVSSVCERSGKTSLAMSLALMLKERNLEVGYLKTFDSDDYDLKLAKELGLDSSCGVFLNRPYADFLISEDPYKLKKKIIDEFDVVSAGKDVVIIEGAQTFIHGNAMEICDIQISKLLDTSVLAVARYHSDFVVDEIILAKRHFDERLRKVILNQVSGYKRSYIDSIVEKALSKHNLEISGVIPTDPTLLGIFVSEIAAATNSEYLVKTTKDEIVEQVLVGAMKAEAALSHMRSARNFAFVTGGDRGDLILLAIESGAKCIVATGNLEPSATVITKAEDAGVPILLSKSDTATTLEMIQRKFGRVGIRKEKLGKMMELIKRYVNLEGVLSSI